MAKIVVLVGQVYEGSELTVPVKKMTRAGRAVELLGVTAGEEIAGTKGKAKLTVEAAVTSRRPDQYDALLTPGGHSPDHLRMEADVVSFVKRFGATGRPIVAVCHGPKLLVDADLVRGRTKTAVAVRPDRPAATRAPRWPTRKSWKTAPSSPRQPEDSGRFSRALLGQIHGGSDARWHRCHPHGGGDRPRRDRGARPRVGVHGPRARVVQLDPAGGRRRLAGRLGRTMPASPALASIARNAGEDGLSSTTPRTRTMQLW